MSQQPLSPYPLQWPAGWPRNQSPGIPAFNATIFTAYRGLIHELELLGASEIVVTSNAVLNRDGTPSSRQPRIDDTGVAVYFQLKGEQRVMVCDQWIYLEDNLRALQKMVNAIRGIERWGGRQMVDVAFAGFAALPAATGPQWWEVLGVRPDAARPEIDAAYRRKLKEVHPDVGGDRELFHVVQEAHRTATQGVIAR